MKKMKTLKGEEEGQKEGKSEDGKKERRRETEDGEEAEE